MKKTLIAILVSASASYSSQSKAEQPSYDHLSSFQGGAAEFCAIGNRVMGLPESVTSCHVVIRVLKSESIEAAIQRGEFGSVYLSHVEKNVSEVWVLRNHQLEVVAVPPHSDCILMGTVLTIEQLERLRADSRILNLGAEIPLGPSGGFSTAGGGGN